MDDKTLDKLLGPLINLYIGEIINLCIGGCSDHTVIYIHPKIREMLLDIQKKAYHEGRLNPYDVPHKPYEEDML